MAKKLRMFYLKTITDTNEYGKGEKQKFTYKPKDDTEKVVTLTVTGEANAMELGLPTETPGDTVAIELGVQNKQAKLLMQEDKKKAEDDQKNDDDGDGEE